MLFFWYALCYIELPANQSEKESLVLARLRCFDDWFWRYVNLWSHFFVVSATLLSREKRKESPSFDGGEIRNCMLMYAVSLKNFVV